MTFCSVDVLNNTLVLQQKLLQFWKCVAGHVFDSGFATHCTNIIWRCCPLHFAAAI
jgi:hypothetical protein